MIGKQRIIYEAERRGLRVVAQEVIPQAGLVHYRVTSFVSFRLVGAVNFPTPEEAIVAANLAMEQMEAKRGRLADGRARSGRDDGIFGVGSARR